MQGARSKTEGARSAMPNFIGAGGEQIVGETKINVGPVIKSFRTCLGWSQKYLAEESGVSREYVNMLEHGKRTCSLETLQKLAVALGKDPCDLISAIGNEKEKFELALLLKEIAESEDTSYLREVVMFAQQLAVQKEKTI